MDNDLSFQSLICATHLGLKRQGPGSSEMTLKAFSFINNLGQNSQIADLGCGTGGQTMVLAQQTSGTIIGIDQFAEFVHSLNDTAQRLNLQGRVRGMVGDIMSLPFDKESLDLIWSEGAIDSVGFANGLIYWHGLLKKEGYIAVTCPSWLTDEYPAEVATFWQNAGSRLDTISHNIKVMQKVGYTLTAVFTLPEQCWMDYFIPRSALGKALQEKFPREKIVEDFIASDQYEVELYSKYKQYYGYVFYIGKKISSSPST